MTLRASVPFLTKSLKYTLSCFTLASLKFSDFSRFSLIAKFLLIVKMNLHEFTKIKYMLNCLCRICEKLSNAKIKQPKVAPYLFITRTYFAQIRKLNNSGNCKQCERLHPALIIYLQSLQNR